MCGIAGVFIKDPSLIKEHEGLEQFMDILHLGIEARGRRASGFVAVTRDGGVKMDKAAVTASEFIKTRERLPLDTCYVLLHTRLDTKGSPDDHRNNHPVIHKSCFTVHNGSVRNDDDLYEKYEFSRAGEVDSEIIPAMLYAADFDIDKMKAAFDEMQGAIACATIDPVRHPGKIVLARTDHSPLVYIDTPKFLVWASEKKAIQDAWGKKLGTPPGVKKISDLARNTMLVVSSEGIEEHKIPDTMRPPIQTWTGSYSYGSGARVPPTSARTVVTTTRNPSTQSGSETSDRPLVPTRDIREITEDMRLKNTHSAKLWDDRHKVPFNIQLGPWLMCEVCEERVHSGDLRDSIRGKLCVDCYAGWMTLANAARANQKSTNAAPKHPFSTGEIDKFNSWAQDEHFVHNMALRELSIVTGFDEEALDFLLFRLTTTQEKRVPGLREWREEIMALYDDELDENWQSYDADGDDLGIMILEGPVVDPEVIDAEATEVVSVEKPWDVLRKSPAQLAIAAAPESLRIRFTPQQNPPKKCGCCRRKTKVIVERVSSSEFLGFCNRHFQKCSHTGCKEKPNHTSVRGDRLCHAHARGRDAYADSLLTKDGFKIKGV